MASNGTIVTTKTSEAGYGFPGFIILNWSTTPNAASNKTILTWQAKGGSDYSDTSTFVYAGPIVISINGTTVLNITNRVQLKKNGVIGSGSIEITHNSDGTKSVTVNISAAIYDSSENCTYSGTITLNPIARATQPTLSATSVYMGDILKINLSRADSSFTHDLSYSFVGSSYVTIASTVGTSLNWTCPDLATQIPNASSGVMTIRCVTKKGTTVIGTKTAVLTVKVPLDVLPSISSVAVSENIAGIAEQFGVFVQNHSILNVSINASGAKGSSIKSFNTNFDGNTYTDSKFTSDVITGSGRLKMITTVKDSRGRTAKLTTYVDVVSYTKPQIKLFTCFRCNSTGEAADDGENIALIYKYNVADINGNTAVAVIEYKKSVDTNWNTFMTISDVSADTTTFPTELLSIDYQYDIRLTVTDYFNASSYYSIILPSGDVIFDIKADGKGIAFFKTADKDGVEFGADVKGTAFGLGGATTILISDEDLNDYKNPGIYGITYDSIAASLSNCPSKYAGILRVYSSTGRVNEEGQNYYLIQEYRSRRAQDPIYYRSITKNKSGNWSYDVWYESSSPVPVT
ncbi:MAG: DUF859 family phage minor structural protein [Acutalibacteraceae bacterium]